MAALFWALLLAILLTCPKFDFELHFLPAVLAFLAPLSLIAGECEGLGNANYPANSG